MRDCSDGHSSRVSRYAERRKIAAGAKAYETPYWGLVKATAAVCIRPTGFPDPKAGKKLIAASVTTCVSSLATTA